MYNERQCSRHLWTVKISVKGRRRAAHRRACAQRPTRSSAITIWPLVSCRVAAHNGLNSRAEIGTRERPHWLTIKQLKRPSSVFKGQLPTLTLHSPLTCNGFRRLQGSSGSRQRQTAPSSLLFILLVIQTQTRTTHEWEERCFWKLGFYRTENNPCVKIAGQQYVQRSQNLSVVQL